MAADSVDTGSPGARFVRAALQVNPFDYLQQSGHESPFPDETAYNEAMVEAAVRAEISIVGLTDHHSVKSSEALRSALTAAGIAVFPGFEAYTKDGVHFLCLFDPDTPADEIDRCIGWCGVLTAETERSPGERDCRELLSEARTWNAVTVAAHCTNAKGLLRALKGGARANAWQAPDLLAAAIPGSVQDVPQEYCQILLNADPSYSREHRVALINARDVSEPSGFERDGAWCWLKVTTPTADALRQAFLDPGSRVRLASDELPDAYNAIESITWEGGFLDGLTLPVSENLNVLVGGRGAGKSTVIESIRFVLDAQPYSESAAEAHKGFVSKVLKGGTKVTARVRSVHPSRSVYEVARSVGSDPIVRNDQGRVVKIPPSSVSGAVQVLGQHEIADLSKLPAERTRLIERYVPADPERSKRESEILGELEDVAAKITAGDSGRDRLASEVSAIPDLEERLRRFTEIGLTDRLREQEGLTVGETAVTRANEELARVRGRVEGLRSSSAISSDLLATQVTEAPGGSNLEQILSALRALESEIGDSIKTMIEACDTAADAVGDAESGWQASVAEVRERVNEVLRELQVERIDGQEFVEVRNELERLRTKQRDLEDADQKRGSLTERRSELLTELEDLRAERFRDLDRAVHELNKRLGPELRITVTHQGDRRPLFEFLADEIGGRQDVIRRELGGATAISLRELADACREGPAPIKDRFTVSGKQGESLASLGEQQLMELEVLGLPTTTGLELNVAGVDDQPAWRGLDDLSTGQRATAVLLLLLLDGDAPLIVDQPEDDLDNSFISESIVPRLRREKNRRQFILSSHNPNIPVLGDAELIAVLAADGDADGAGHSELREVGSIDTGAIRSVVEVLEGGKGAFETRRRKYGF